MRVIFEQGPYRIVEYRDTDSDMEDLKGDSFNPECCDPMIEIERLRELERDFKELVAREGVFGYALERWEPRIGAGWEHIDSCWGFVGQFSESDEKFNHYIVDEMKTVGIPEDKAKRRKGK